MRPRQVDFLALIWLLNVWKRAVLFICCSFWSEMFDFANGEMWLFRASSAATLEPRWALVGELCPAAWGAVKPKGFLVERGWGFLASLAPEVLGSSRRRQLCEGGQAGSYQTRRAVGWQQWGSTNRPGRQVHHDKAGPRSGEKIRISEVLRWAWAHLQCSLGED